MRCRFARVATLSLLLALTLATPARADDAELEAVRDRLVKLLPDVKREDIRRSVAAGLYEVRIGHAFGYVTADGRHLVSGDLTNLETGEQVTEQRRRDQRLATVAAFNEGAIEFAPPRELVRYWVTIFTDVECEYCRLLHREVPQMNRLGIGVRYLFFSKYGAPSEAFKLAQIVWCDGPASRGAALTRGLLEHKVKEASQICDNPVLEQYMAAVSMGLKGTPVSILPNGEVFYGYVKAEAMLKKLQEAEADAGKSGR